jgi:predicted nuclease of predicted toxin-antitoxin system
MIRFLIDENIPPAIGRFLHTNGFEVKDVREMLRPGAQDEEVMSLARQEHRVLVTFDKHFSNLVLYPPGSHEGIIRIRIHPPVISEIITAFKQLLAKLDIEAMRGSLIVLEREGFRVRKAPLD